ncbi:MAG: DEAD/DEAH box helicase [bacterium]
MLSKAISGAILIEENPIPLTSPHRTLKFNCIMGTMDIMDTSMNAQHHALRVFHPLIGRWFQETYRCPTDIQEKAWRAISEGKHVLLTAPTGSGKTLAAFLWAINQLAAGTWPAGQLRVLYVSPLKALNNDIGRNLITPLRALESVFEGEGMPFPKINVHIRSGDTPSHERQRMLRKPPEILITTPESLNLILSGTKARALFRGLATVIVDEIHAVADNKRGTHLITAIDRLVILSGEFQRIGLSATIRPLKKVANFIAGYRMKREGEEVLYQRRSITTVESGMEKEYSVKVSFPEVARKVREVGEWWSSLISEFVGIIEENRATLLFTNNRKLTEKITRLINERQKEILAYSHHGSLSRELRRHVEQRLKEGKLKAIIATSSLELGIDIGTLNEIILLQTPFSISAAIQRVGRAGHSITETSKARFYPLHGKDLISCAVMAKAVMAKDMEHIHIPECPLDVLAQVILSMVGVESWDLRELFHVLRASYPFHLLRWEHYHAVIEMLAGRYADSRIRELRPKISIDTIDNRVYAKEGVLWLIYSAGGTIPDRGYYTLRLSDTKAIIGELDEEFVWERRIGDTFSFGTGVWKIQKIDHTYVEVIPVKKAGSMAPFFRADALMRSFYLSEKIGLFLEEWNQRMDDGNALACLKKEYFLEDEAASALMDYWKRQKKATGSDLPHRHLILIEHFQDPLNRSDSKQVILHTFWGSRLNLPFSIALSQSWEEHYHYPLHIFQDNDCILLNLPDHFSVQDLFHFVTPENINILLRKRLAKTGIFGACFRENAGRALLLPKQSFHKRMPLWLNRLRSKKLLHAVMHYENFPICAETFRTCSQDIFDLSNLIRVLDEIREGIIIVKEVSTRVPSPFCANVIWQQTNKFMYEDDAPSDGATFQLKRDIVEDLVFTPELRPTLSPLIIKEFNEKIQRTYPGYAPTTPLELLDHLKERVLIPEAEWDTLLSHDHSIYEQVMSKIRIQRLQGAEIEVVIALEQLGRLTTGLSGDEEIMLPLFSQWLQFYGPLPKSFMRKIWGFDQNRFDALLKRLCQNQVIVAGHISDNAVEQEFCDAQNLEMLLRIARKKARPEFKALPISSLPLFIAHYQGLTTPGSSIEGVKKSLEKLWGYPARAELWESEIFPARMEPYYPSWLDTLWNESDLVWFGCGREKVGFCFETDLELFQKPTSDKKHAQLSFFPEKGGKYTFWDLSEQSGLSSTILTTKLWDMTWEGLISNDKIQALRKGIENKFQPSTFQAPSRGRMRGIRSQLNRWHSSRPMQGNWYILQIPGISKDPIEREGIIRDRIRMLFQRYGILFREILTHELREAAWPSIFRGLRLMELSGEIMAGHFFSDIPGMQFICYHALREIRKKLPEDAIYWMNAADPSSVCGMKIEALKGKLPSRIPSNHLVFRGSTVVLISTQKGRKLHFYVSPEDPDLEKYLKVFRVQVNRKWNPVKRIIVERINHLPAAESPYKDALAEYGFRTDYKNLILC